MYGYITDNNLERRQTYQYSSFQGTPFLTVYEQSRGKLLNGIGNRTYPLEILLNATMEGIPDHPSSESELLTKHLLSAWLEKELQSEQSYTNGSDELLKFFVKKFEVRKRIFEKYDLKLSPLTKSYNVHELYILFAVVINHAYMRTQNLFYLNCALKLGDTLLSISELLVNRISLELVSYTTELELMSIRKLRNEKGI